MKDNNKKKISLTTYIISLLIMLLIIIALVIYIIINSKQSEENKNENTYRAKQQNNTGNTITTSKTNQQGEELDLESEEVKEIIKKINFPRCVEESIYKNGDFTLDNIPNDLILKMAWSQINDDDKVIEHNPEKIEIVTKEAMEKYIKDIFGSSIIYEDASFTKGDSDDGLIIFLTDEDYDSSTKGDSDGERNSNEYIVKYDDEKEKYIASGSVVSGLHWDKVVEQVDKVIKTDNIIEIYVKTAFLKERDDVDYPDELGAYSGPFYYVYKDFKGEKVVESRNEGEEVTEDIMENLNTYVYTLEYDEEEESYYLSRFCAESEETSSKQDNKRN